MRIVHVITRLVRGGADENTLLSCNAQAAAGHDVHLIYGAEVSEAMVARMHGALKGHQIADLVRPLQPLKDFSAVLELAKLFRAIKPDIVHTHTSKAGILGRVAARLAGGSGVVHGVHILPFLNVGPAERTIYLGAERLLAPFTDAFVNVSGGMRDAGVSHGVGRPDKHSVVPSGMDVAQFREAAPINFTTMAQDLKLDPETLAAARFIVMAAALEPRKRVVEFLDVLASVVERVPQARLIVLGEGHDRTRIEARAAALGLANRVHLLGFRTDVQHWIARADVCALSSEREGLPRVVVQYALAGKPMVITALPGVEAAVRPGESGYLVPADRLDLMTKPLVDLLSDAELNARMSASARAVDLSAWSVEHMVAKLEDVYREVLAAKSGTVIAAS